ncbi:MAG: hypothetical protein QOE62_3807 [Actinomycetota bacterium]|nr:hypothetical protein [Actinomycetota bacterium]
MQLPTAIDSTGRTDVTKRLQTFVSKVPSGRVIRFRPGGRYRLDGTLMVSRRRRLTFDGAGALVFATTRGDQNRSQFRVRGGSGITFRNIKIQGASANAGTGDNAYIPKLAKQMGIRFEGVDGAEVDHVTITNVFGDFVYVGLDAKEVPSRNVWIHDSSFRSNGRQGVAVTSATGVIIERNVFFNTRRSTIDLEPTGHRWKVDHVFILNNVVGKGRLLFVASGGQGPVSNVVVSGNRLDGHALSIDVKQSGKLRRSNWVVVNNVSNVDVENNRVMRFMAVDGLLLRANRETITGKDPAVLLSDVCGAVVSGNDFGTGQVQHQGTACAARLVIPQPPAIPGRSASAGPALVPRSHSGTAAWVWVVVALGGIVLVLGVFVLVRRRRRRPPTGPTPPEPTEPSPIGADAGAGFGPGV